MDIYAPTEAFTSKKKLPVYFFIQGGGFASLSNMNYNGTGLVTASDFNIIVVTFNYRVGPYGFLAGDEVERGASLNNGLKDQIKALKWVQKYISMVNTDHLTSYLTECTELTCIYSSGATLTMLSLAATAQAVHP